MDFLEGIFSSVVCGLEWSEKMKRAQIDLKMIEGFWRIWVEILESQVETRVKFLTCNCLASTGFSLDRRFSNLNVKLLVRIFSFIFT
jgi:hypothetical protein